jgi:hypothetical protein
MKTYLCGSLLAFTIAACGGATAAPGPNVAGGTATSPSPADTGLSPTVALSAQTTQDAVAPAAVGATATPPTAGTATKLAPVGTDSGRSLDDIKAVVVAARPRARACYDTAEAAHPGIEGDIVISFLIDPKGDVKSADVDPTRTTIADAAVGPCIVSVIKSLKFPASAKGFETRSSYPFNFRPKRAVTPVPSR